MEQTIINNDDYKFKVRKTWIEATQQWHIEFLSQIILECRFEMFLTEQELQKLKDAL